MSLAALLMLLAQSPQLPAPGEARPAALPGFTLHVLAGEDLPADLLRPLGREGVVLWLRTRSNALRESTAEALARFQESYVQLRPPLSEAHARLLARAPGAGVWLSAGDLGGPGLYRLGNRRLALQLAGPLAEETAAAVRKARPVRLSWEPGSDADLLQWGLFRQLPGRKLLRISGKVACEEWTGSVPLWVDARSRPWPSPCGQGGRAKVRLDAADEELRWLFERDPTIELEIEIGDDEAAAISARALVHRLATRAAFPSTFRK